MNRGTLALRALPLGVVLIAGTASGQAGLYIVEQHMGPYSTNPQITSSSTIEFRDSPNGPRNNNVSIFQGLRIYEDGPIYMPPYVTPGNQCGSEGTNTQAGRVTTTAECYGSIHMCYRSIPRFTYVAQAGPVSGYGDSYGRQCVQASTGGGGGGTCDGGGGGGGELRADPAGPSGRRPLLPYQCSCLECPTDPCCGESPILIDLDGGGFKLTGANDPVRFDLNANGRPETIGWTERGSETAFLVLDLNRDGQIGDGRELFGNYSPMPDGSKAANGYVALAVYDEPVYGGSGDGRISDDDAIYPRLQLWIDENHDGAANPGELFSLEDASVESIDLRYHEERKVDRWGNAFKYRSSATLVNDRGRRRRVDVYDVYFVRVQGQ